MNASSTVGLLLFGVCLWIALKLVYAQQTSNDSVYRLLRLTSIATFIIASYGFFAVLGGGWGILVWVSGLVVAVMILVQSRAVRRRALFDLLALAVEKQMPLPELLGAFSADQPRTFRLRLDQAVADLRAGVPVGDALERARGLLPRMGLAAIHLGQRSGALAKAMRQAVATDALRRPIRQALASRGLYLCWILVAIAVIMTFVVITILPSLEYVLNDFELEIPPITVALIRMSRSGFLGYVGLLTVLIIYAATIYYTLYFIGITKLPRIGPAHRFERADLLRALALVVEANRPMDVSLAELGDCYPEPLTQLRLQGCAAEVAAGADWIVCLLGRRLIAQADAAVIRSAESVGNLSWALREVADGVDRRWAYRMENILEFTFPVLIIMVGAVVLFFAVSCFIPILKLTMALT